MSEAIAEWVSLISYWYILSLAQYLILLHYELRTLAVSDS